MGCECAEFLSEYGKKVTLFEMKEGLAQDAYWNIRDQLLQRMKKYEVRAVTGAAATADAKKVHRVHGKRGGTELRAV